MEARPTQPTSSPKTVSIADIRTNSRFYQFGKIASLFNKSKGYLWKVYMGYMGVDVWVDDG